MKLITFTITEDEIREVAQEDLEQKLSGKQAQEVLDTVECDEILWQDIHTSIIEAIRIIISVKMEKWG